MTGFFTNWITKIVDKAVAARFDTAKQEIDYDELAQALISGGLDYHRIAESVELSDLADEINTDDLEQRIAEKVDIDDVIEKVADNIDTGDVAERVKEDFELDYSEFDIDYPTLANEMDMDALAENVRENMDVDYDELEQRVNYESLARALVKMAASAPAS